MRNGAVAFTFRSMRQRSLVWQVSVGERRCRRAVGRFGDAAAAARCSSLGTARNPTSRSALADGDAGRLGATNARGQLRQGTPRA
jgi:hypothetical protein